MIALSIATLVVCTTRQTIYRGLARLLAHNHFLSSKMFLVDRLALNIIEDIPHGGKVFALRARVSNNIYSHDEVAKVNQRTGAFYSQRAQNGWTDRLHMYIDGTH